MFRLYVGLVRDGEWYNHAETEKVKGGTLAILDTANETGSALLYNMLAKGAVRKLFTESGKAYDLKEKDYEKIKGHDCFKISLELMKQFTKENHPVIPESLRCYDCSARQKRSVEVRLETSWHKLIEDGLLPENYSPTPDCSWWTDLPSGLVIGGEGKVINGTFKRIKREPVTLGDLMRIHSMNLDTEVDQLFYTWDAEIVEIEGMTEKEMNLYVKANARDSFSKKYFLEQDDIDAMTDAEPLIGIDASNRFVACPRCGRDIGGYLDYRHFFDWLSATSKRTRRQKAIL